MISMRLLKINQSRSEEVVSRPRIYCPIWAALPVRIGLASFEPLLNSISNYRKKPKGCRGYRRSAWHRRLCCWSWSLHNETLPVQYQGPSTCTLRQVVLQGVTEAAFRRDIQIAVSPNRTIQQPQRSASHATEKIAGYFLLFVFDNGHSARFADDGRTSRRSPISGGAPRWPYRLSRGAPGKYQQQN